jgi:hypothetical protein
MEPNAQPGGLYEHTRFEETGWSMPAIADELNLDRKQTMLGAFFAIAETSR